MVYQKRYKRGKKSHRRKTGRVKRSRVKRSRVKRSRVKRTRMRGGMEGTSGTTVGVTGDTEVPFIAYDLNETWNSEKYKEFMDIKEKSKDERIKGRCDRYIKKYKEMCKKEYLEDKQKAGELNISLEKYLDLKKKAERAQMTVEDFLSLKRTLDTSQTGTSLQKTQQTPTDSTLK